MNLNRISSLILSVLFAVSIPVSLKAQFSESLFETDPTIDPTKKGELSVTFDNISFFKNNEYKGAVQNGYTLPGLWIQPKVTYYPLSNMKVELGAHLLKYWGTTKYPCFAYQNIAKWKGSKYQTAFHLLPYFSAQIALSKQVNLIFGNIYGGANHHLIEPLYNPELNLTADPEAGLQLLYNSKLLTLDAWVNWESFIFEKDTHQEAFTFGLSTETNINNKDAKVHLYAPLQLLFVHRGGELDTITTSSVQTWLNAAAGVGATYTINCGVLKRANLELMATYFGQQAGDLLPFNSGYGFYPKLTVDIHDFQVKAAYWYAHDFITAFGNPFYGSISTAEPGMTFHNPSMFCLGASYSKRFAKGFALGIHADVFSTLGTKSYLNNVEGNDPAAMSLSIGAYLRINPSFLIKKFR